MLDKIKKRISALWKEHVCDTFPDSYDQDCIICNKGSCIGCPHNK